MKVIVTGGTGFLGSHLRTVKPEWKYISSKDCDLTSQRETIRYFKNEKPNAIIHLAARVGGIKDNIANQAMFYYQNTMMNTNVLHAAHLAGVPRILSSLSTCAFPDKMWRYPFEEEDLFSGPPTETNFSYAISKRSLHAQSIAYRKQYNLNYSTFCPSNIYGPGDHFGQEASHFIAALVHKVALSQDGDTVNLWGTGLPLRQQLYIKDLCEIIPILLDEHNSTVPLIVAPSENLTILEMARTLVKQSGKDITLSFDGSETTNGQFRKDGSNKKLLEILGKYKFTSFKQGVKMTYDWYIKNGVLNVD